MAKTLVALKVSLSTKAPSITAPCPSLNKSGRMPLKVTSIDSFSSVILNLNLLEEILLKLLFSTKPPILIILLITISDLLISDGV